MSRRPLQEYSHLWTRARRARRGGDPVAADRWQRLAERELRIFRQSEEAHDDMLLRSTLGLQERLKELQASTAKAEQALAATRARARSSSPD